MQTLTRKALLTFLISYSTVSIAQSTAAQDIDNLAVDLVYLSREYVTPAAESASYQSSGGWYTSAKPKDLWDLEISLQGNLLFINQKYAEFVIDEANLQNVRIPGDATTATTPTALGGTGIVTLEGSIDGDTFEFDSPEGLDEAYAKHGQIQATLGLWKGTSLIGRYSPKIKINKTYYQIVGFGLQHNVSQWIPSLKESSFSLAILGTYSVYTVSDNFSEVRILNLAKLNSVIVDGKSFMFNAIASKELGKFNISSGIGFTSSKFDYEMGGEGDFILTVINESLKELNASKTLFKADLGVNYNIGKFSINSMFTFGKFTNFVAGINYNL